MVPMPRRQDRAKMLAIRGSVRAGVPPADDEETLTRDAQPRVFSNGGYADYMMVPHPRYLFDIGDLAPDRAAPLACSGVTTYGALKKSGDAQERAHRDHAPAASGLMRLACTKAMGRSRRIVC